ncbi:MAG TPA: ATP-binding protein [Acidobacteriaceae bacterium]
MIDGAQLRRVAAFSNLPDDQIEWFLNHAEEVCMREGGTFVERGDPADWMFVLLEGQFQWRGEFGGDTVVLPANAGDITGVYPFSRMKQFTVTGRALTEGRILRFPCSLFPELVQKMPELTTTLVGMMSDRVREGTRIEQQRDRLVSLGKLSAGLAHELNNPSAAATRAASQLAVTWDKMKSATFQLGRCALTDDQRLELEKLEHRFSQVGPAPDSLTLPDLEDEISVVLSDCGEIEVWQFSPALARCHIQPAELRALLVKLDPNALHATVVRLAASAELAVLADVIVSSTTRISDLVRTVKEYTYMDQAPVQDVDIVRSLETTLTILDHKLRNGIVVQRDYQPIPLLVDSFGSELNQVWTNLILNAAEAMAGQGELRVRTFRQEHDVVVEIGDTGPGITPDVQSHMFEPFFTTKGVGEGTGLGLDTAQRIVRRHRGDIHAISIPGDTRFQVWLPLADSIAPKPTPLPTSTQN